VKLAVVALIVAAVALSIASYSHLPERVPIHWNWTGQADNYGSREVGVSMMPATMIVLAGLFAILPAISPSGFDIERRSRAYRGICLAVLLLMLGIHVHLLLSMMNVARKLSGAYIPLFVGAVLVIVGNYLPKMPRNFFVGIRTPWTLADEDVWFRTHRLGGVVVVICGVLLMVVGPFVAGGPAEFLTPGLIAAAALLLVIYSFVIYRRPKTGLGKGEVKS
jgi:uncharacterized membrane protein